MQLRLTVDNLLNILTESEYSKDDILIETPSIRLTLILFAKNFLLIVKEQKSLEIPHSYLIALLKRDDLVFHSEDWLLRCIENWGARHLKCTKTDFVKLREILFKKIAGESLMDCIRFEHINVNSKMELIKKYPKIEDMPIENECKLRFKS